MAYRLVADVARKLDALRPMDRDPPVHRFVDRRIPHERVGRRLPRHVEVDGIMTHLSSLPKLTELDPLDLERREPLPRDRMAAERIVRAWVFDTHITGWKAATVGHVTLGDNAVLWDRSPRRPGSPRRSW